MISHSSAAGSVASVDARQLGRAEALFALLTSESEALQARREHDLVALAEHKQQLLNELEAGESERQQITAAAKRIEAGGRKFESAESPDITWHQLQECLKKCRELNLANGRLVVRRKAVVEQGLRILRGESADMSAYTANGRPARSSVGRQLGAV